MKYSTTTLLALSAAGVVKCWGFPEDIPPVYIWASQRQETINQCEVESNCGGLVFDSVSPDELENPPDETTTYESYGDNVTAAERTAPGKAKTEAAFAVRKMLAVPLYYNKNHTEVYVSEKPWLIQRGSVKIAASALHDTVLKVSNDIDVEEAQQWCLTNPGCVAFSFPWQGKHLRLLDEVVFVNQIAGFDYGDDAYVKRHYEDENPSEDFVPKVDPSPDWITHVLHDRERLTNNVERNINIDEAKWAEHSKSPYRPCCTANATLPSLEELQAVDNLERISCDISREEFYEKYEKTRTPVMLTGCTEPWPAHVSWKDIPTLLNRFDNETTWDISKQEMSWGEFKDYYAERQSAVEAGATDVNGVRIFMKLNPDNPHSDPLHSDYGVPPPFKDADVYERLPNFKTRHFPRDFGPLHYWIVGSAKTGTGPHADPLTTDAWSSLVSGHKWWIIYPKITGVLSEIETQCHRQCSTSMTDFHVTGKRSEVSWYASVAKHANKFYYGHEKQNAHFVLQNPGETIYLPFGMIHSVMNVDDTIAITEKFASFGNFAEVWREILTSGYQPQDWRYMYYKVLTKEQRAVARTVVWPIVKESVQALITNENVYVGTGESVHDEYGEEEEEEEPTYVSDEEYDAMSPEEKAGYDDYLASFEGSGDGEEEEEEPVILDQAEFNDLTAQEKVEYRDYVASFGEGWEMELPFVATYFNS